VARSAVGPVFAPDSSTGLLYPRDRCVQGEVMTSWYPGWQVAVAWLLTVALAGLIYFVPITTLIESVSDHSGTIAAAADGP
jgi:hypothetical protein